MSRDVDDKSKGPDSPPELWGERLKYWRERLGWTQTELADKIGRNSRQTVGYQESTKEPGSPLRMLVEICNASAQAREDLLDFVGLQMSEARIPAPLVSLMRRARKIDNEGLDDVARILDDALRMAERCGLPRERDGRDY